ncbi:flagellar biosynthesis protein FlhB [Comamonas sp. NLF-1-9]|uniref:EscU/YscU/HrcU family type III secretion system export apparatus switch protein n=1 Tax=Comamonas sp. NLF-1-9 TaxID=2853163 RepID=UPI001C4402E2|nr:EscU/YscU/HrcU family type III secretion system export apparatus switch protein [Comamonas sp. NLF-1-9]QXL84231.1 EscU/YscU/HrcU family type III secretion system export apparatus switch protein [Comamonas sp. NLF-1-9]
MDSSQDKQLPATERKLQKAREDGQAPRSQELSHLAVLGVLGLVLWSFFPTLLDVLTREMGRQLSFDAVALRAPADMFNRLQAMLLVGLAISLVLALLAALAAVAASLGSGGWIWSLKALQPQFSRLDPLQGVKNLVSKQKLSNLGKMLLLATALIYVAWKYMSTSAEKMAQLVLQPAAPSLRDAGQWVGTGVALLLLVVLLFAVVDVPLQQYLHRSRLKMSHEEVKQEHKDSDGNPLIRQRIRQKQREVAERASVSAVPRADFVVMNPTHYAVALRYDEASMGAPQVISKGTDLVAFRIRDLAMEHAIPVLRSPMLARALYAHADLDQPIPAQLYTAVAQVLAYVYRLKAAMRGEGRMPDAPPVPDAHIPPQLDPHSPQAQHR